MRTASTPHHRVPVWHMDYALLVLVARATIICTALFYFALMLFGGKAVEAVLERGADPQHAALVTLIVCAVTAVLGFLLAAILGSQRFGRNADAAQEYGETWARAESRSAARRVLLWNPFVAPFTAAFALLCFLKDGDFRFVRR